MAVTYEVQKRKASSGAWTSVGKRSQKHITASGLTTCTDYEFRVRAQMYGGASTFFGGGAQQWSNWSAIGTGSTLCSSPIHAPVQPTPTPAPTPTPTPATYTESFESVGLSWACSTGLRKRHSKGSAEPVTDSGGVTHSGSVEIYVAQITWPFATIGDWCVQMRVTSNAVDPGATALSWRGDLYVTESGIRTGDLPTLFKGNITGFLDLQTAVEPNRQTDSSVESEPGSCVFCQGGTVQADYYEVGPRYVKIPAAYAYGYHVHTGANGLQTELSSSTNVEIPREWGSWFENIPAITTELLLHYAEEIVNKIIAWIRGLL